MTVNNRSLEEYFPRDTSRMRILEPFELTETKGQYDLIVKVKGGGKFGPGRRRAAWDFARAGVRPRCCGRRCARNGMLTRDPREVERKKYGHHKARKRPQYSKR